MWIHRATQALAAVVLVASGPPAMASGQSATGTQTMEAARKSIGEGALKRLTSLRVEGTSVRNIGERQVNTDVEVLIELPDKYMRSEASSGGMVNIASTVGFSGDRPLKSATADQPGAGGVMIRIGPGPMSGPPPENVALTPEERQQRDRAVVRSAKQEMSRLMLGWLAMAPAAPDAEYTDAGIAESPDGRARIVDVKDPSGLAVRLFLDETTHLPLMLTYQAPQLRMVTTAMRGDMPAAGAPRPPAFGHGAAPDTAEGPPMAEHTLYFDDWREVEGIRFPHRLRRAVAGATTEEWTVSRVRVNPKIDSKRFEAAQ